MRSEQPPRATAPRNPTTKGTAMTALPARRYKLASELDPDEQRLVKRPGGSGQIERDEYVGARRALLDKPDQEDPPLVVRLLREEAAALSEAAGRREERARDRLTVDDWLARDAAEARGDEPSAAFGARTGRLRQEAAAMQAGADELEAHMGDVESESAAEDHYQQIRTGG